MSEPQELTVFDFAQRLPGGFQLPARMTVLTLGPGQVALVSPIPIDAAMAREIAAIGQVLLLIAPNLMHHMYLGDASKRYPHARVLAPRGLRAKRADVTIHGALEDEQPELAAHVDVIPIRGAPGLDEFVFFHRASATLVVTDLVFNMEQPKGLLTNVILFVVGCHGRLAASRAWYSLVKDRALVRSSMERIMALPVCTLIMAHGAIVRRGARERLAAALRARFMGRARPALPTPERART